MHSKAKFEPRVIAQARDLVLLEYQDHGVLRRSWIPAGVAPTVEEGRKGIPYGVDTSELEIILQGALSGLCARLEHNLHARGLYTAADVERTPEAGRVVEAALREAITPLAANVIEYLRGGDKYGR